MKARKCDRCGKLYECYETTKQSLGNALNVLRLRYPEPGYDSGNCENFVFNAKDLCRECMESFCEWFGEGLYK